MTSPIAFTPMNVPLPTDPADMPHVLGDPADTGWKGTAERINDNFDAITAWCNIRSAELTAMRIPANVGTGTAVLTPATNWTLTNGFATARTLSFYGGVNLVFLTFRLVYTGTAERATLGLVSQPIATLVAALRPTVNAFYRTAGSYYTHGTTFADYYVGCDLGIIATTGVVQYYLPSTIAAPGESPTQVTASMTYFTGSS